jgi:hypothetical protein
VTTVVPSHIRSPLLLGKSSHTKNAAKLIAETSKDVTINVDGVKELAQVVCVSL